MGNSRSSEIRHEKLDERNEQYFAKVRARNKIKTRDMSIPSPTKVAKKSKSFRSPFKRSSKSSKSMSKSSALLDETPESNIQNGQNDIKSSDVLNVRSKAAMLERAEQHAHPQSINQNILPRIPSKRKNKTKPNKSSKTNMNEKNNDGNIGALPQPRGSGKKQSKKSLPTNRGNDFENNSEQSSQRSLLSSQKKAFKIQNENRAFEAMLSNGMIWTEIPRGGKITCVSFAPSGKSLLAVGSEAGAVSIIQIGKKLSQTLTSLLSPSGLYDDNNGKNSKYSIVTEIPREGKVRTLDWSPDGQYLAIGGNDCTAVIVHVETMRVIQEIEREDRIYSVRWSPDGDMLAIGGFDGMVAVISFLNGGEICELITEIPRLGLVLTLDWSANRQYLAVGGSDKRAAIVDVNNWEVVGEVQRPGSVQCLEWSPDGRILGVGGHDGVVAVIDIETRTILKEIVRNRGGATCRITDITWSPDGAFLCIAGTDNICAIFETKSFVMVHDIQRDEHVTCVDWQSETGKYLAVGGDDRSVAILKTGGMMGSEQDSVTEASSSVSDSNADDWSASGSSVNSKQAVPNWIAMQEFGEEKNNTEANGHVSINAMTFSHGSDYIAISGSNGVVAILDTRTWSTIHEIPTKATVQSLSFSPSNEYLALGSENSSTAIISLPSFNLLTTIPSIASIHCLSFSPDSSRLALGDADGMLSVISVVDWNLLGEMDESESPIYALDWSIDGEYLAIGRSNAVSTIHDCSSVYRNFWVPRAELIRKSAVNTIAFSPAGDYLAIGGGDWTVGVYMRHQNWALGHELKMDGWILTVGWSADGRYLGMGGTDLAQGGVIVDTTTWEKVEQVEDETSQTPGGVAVGEEVHCIAWSDDGEYVAIAGSGGVPRIVDAKTWSVQHSISTQVDDLPTQIMEKRRTILSSSSSVEAASSTEELIKDDQTLSSKESSTELLLAKDTPDDGLIEREQSSSIPKLKKISYFSREEPVEFLSTCELLLSHYDHHKPSSLGLFYSSILNIRNHILCVNDASPSLVEPIVYQDKGETLLVLCRVLQSATILMEEVLEDISGIDDWWGSKDKYDLDWKEAESLKKWNTWWREVDSNIPRIDIELLRQIDDADEDSFEDPKAYHSIEEKEPGMRPTGNQNYSIEKDMDKGYGAIMGPPSHPSHSWSSDERL